MFFGYMDPTYLIIMLATMGLSIWASAKTKGAFHKYGQVRTRNGMTGADVAQAILRDHGIHDVTVEPIHGSLTDHYDPRSKTLRLSEPVYRSNSVSAFGVAAHEVGHAIQHARGYAPLKFRSMWVPIAGIGSQLGMILIIIGIVMASGQRIVPGSAVFIGWTGLALFACTTIFTLITLPVEFDASRRALATLEARGYLSGEEMPGARKVLNAAAMTYVAAFVSSLLMLLYFASRLGVFGRHE